jgi:hypothetical protein
MSFCWGSITLLNVMTYWGTYWKLTPQGLFESKVLLMRRVIPYSDIQDVSPCPTSHKQRSSRMKITILSGKPVLASSADYGRFVSAPRLANVELEVAENVTFREQLRSLRESKRLVVAHFIAKKGNLSRTK